MIQLETYRGTKSRYTCPACNSRHSFSRYITDGGDYLSDDVGRCDRESKCGYHYKPKEYFADNPTMFVGQGKQNAQAKKRSRVNYGFADENGLKVKYKAKRANDTPDFIPFEQFRIKRLSNYADE